MKNKLKLLSLLMIANGVYAQQNPTNTDPGGAPSGTNSQQYWSRAGNSSINGTNNIFGTNAGFNSPIYTVTNGVNRTTLMGFQPPGSITGAFGLGTNLLLPQAKLHIQDFGTDATFDAQGRMFRTDGIGNRNNRWNMFTTNGAGTSLERLRIETQANSSNISIQVVQRTGVLSLQTGNGGTRNRLMIQRDSIGLLNGINTAGFVAIYTHTPILQRMAPRAPLHVFGVEQANAQGWTRGILLSNSAILQWDGGNTSNNPRGFFIGHPSDLPNGNLFGGIVGNGTASNLDVNAPVDYSYTISVNSAIPVTSPPNTLNPLGSWNFFKNVLISQVNANQVTVNNERRLGVNTLLPQNVVEINTAETSAIPGRSGLRFTDLTASSNVLSNPGNGVLAVDSNGNVIYVEQTLDSLGFGYTCDADSSTYFTEHRKINFNNNNFYFEGDVDTANLNRVGIGWPCGTTLKAKLDVFTENKASTAGSFMTLHNWLDTVNFTNFTGAVGMTLGDGGGTAAFYGLRGHVFSTNFSSANGVYGFAPVTTNSYAGYFDGDVFSTGNIYGGSDSTLKKDINKLTGGLKIITQLVPKTFYWDAQDNPQFNFSNQLQYGFIAQEVQNVLPSLVKQSRSEGEYDANGNFISNPKDFLALNYNAIIPINTQAIIELNQK